MEEARVEDAAPSRLAAQQQGREEAAAAAVASCRCPEVVRKEGTEGERLEQAEPSPTRARMMRARPEARAEED